ncbi:carboxylic acid reductase [Nocardia alni]|uniref:carboxylic acid reductase n=1 Tax=Nocardia alni TaxID=2815723 RepID=UPI001C24EBEB|nr:carboxylic acid reductase [Nocardia alni]
MSQPPQASNPFGADTAVTRAISAEQTVSGVLRCLAAGYFGRTALSWRGDDGGWESMTYAALANRVFGIASAFSARLGVRPGDRVAMIGFTSAQYTLIDLAVIGPLAAVSVPLQNNAALSNWEQILRETEPRVIGVSADELTKLATVLRDMGPEARPRVVVFDVPSPEAQAAASIPGLEVVTLEELEQLRDEAAFQECDPAQLSMLIYTSGSTGTPKGAMYAQRAIVRWLFGGFPLIGDGEGIRNWITLNFLPMSHARARSTLYQTLSNGGTAYFTRHSDLSSLLEDLAEVQPNQLHFVPRIWEMLYQELQADRSRGIDEATALSELRQRYFGDQPLRAFTGSAPTSSEVADFVERLVRATLTEGYGSTEAGAILRNGHVMRPPVNAYKLLDVPELGYYGTDRPFPRGELLVKTEYMFMGYYRRPELTETAFDDDGYYRTGDIMAQVGPDELRYLDRRNNVIKLSQGEFITISYVESTLTVAPIRQMYVYGNSARPYLLGVAVPTGEAIARAGGDLDSLRTDIVAAIREIGETAGLTSAETPRDVIVETTPFSLSNGLLTGIGKLARPQLKQHYGDRLESLYADLAGERDRRLRAAHENSGSRTVLDTVIDVVAALLDLRDGEIVPASRFIDLGGDSLNALTLGSTLHDIFDVKVPVGLITSPATDLGSLAAFLENPELARPTVESVHGEDSDSLRASDLTVDKLIDAEILANATTLPAAAHTPRTVLITGSTGFLGRYLVLEWLRHADADVVCLVRASDDAAAQARLEAVFGNEGSALREEFDSLSKARLRVVAGDKDAPQLGLDDDTWTELTRDVELIVDSGALVNHVLPYRELFGPNVLGTAELIRLALTGVRKRYVYISTVGVGSQIPRDSFVEDADIRAVSPVRRIEAGYASGYANSKWAGEVLLRDAHDRFGLPVTVFRCDMILANARDTGQINVPDMFTRLLQSVLATGLAPDSFHPLAADGSRARAHHDALPVDFLASAIRALSQADDYRTYHAMNPHEDGIGFDRYIDWLVAHGEAITRVGDYKTWFQRFSAAVETLPDRRKHHSVLPLLHNYVEPIPPSLGAGAPADRFRDAVRGAELEGAQDIPHITPEIIDNYARSLRALDLI